MLLTTNVKGQIATTKVEMRALELGFLPSRPLYDARYDLVLDDKISLKRIQVKYADGSPSHSEGAVVAKLSYETRTKKLYTYQEYEVDALIVYIPKVDRLCYIPKEVFENKQKLYIRLQPSKNMQKHGIIFAEDYYW